MSETAWLIEHPRDPRYRYGQKSWYAGKDGFTVDLMRAVRYARREDAEREIDRLPISLAKHLLATKYAFPIANRGIEKEA